MSENRIHRSSDSSSPKKRNGNVTVRNYLIIAALVTAAIVIFVFGINRWKIDFKLIGESSVTSECGEPYKDQGAEAEVTGSILSFVHHPISVKVSTERVNIHEPGTYVVTYSAKFMWLSASSTRDVVIVDTTPPVIELKHIDDYYTLPHHAYEEEGFTATDNHDGDITSKVVSEEKDGHVYYTVSDQYGNKATADREIFYDDRNAPVFSFPSGEEGFLFQGQTWEDDVQAEDDADGDVSDRVKSEGSVDTGKVGTYIITYTVSDEWGNVAKKNRYVTVKRVPVTADEAAAAAVITPVSAQAAANANTAANAAPDTTANAAAGAGAAAAQTAKPATADPKKIIYLTFDDGPGKYTEELLKILDDHKVLATFFVTAAYKDYQDLIGKEYNAGHSVGVHTATHEYSEIYASTDAYWEDFNKMQDIIQEQTGCRTDIFRFPGGASNTVSANYSKGIMTELARQSAEKGYIYVDWNVTSGDAGDTTDSEVLYQNMMKGIHTYENSFILCHDIKDFTIATMDRFITDALKEGYTFLPITSESRTCHHGINN
ncbi:MAG: polysaccharide deacetylase family protein [Lachnospiraceae bacterium]|nr:polysaccharide deacetylase family protein [Lachnospiraceae bacterium]